MHLTFPRSPERLLLTLAISLFPFYVFPSGGLQPSHLAFLILSVPAIVRYGIPRQSWLFLFLILTIYSFLIESIAGIYAQDPRHIINSAFFLFNLILMIGVYWLILRYGASALRAGLFTAMIFAVISIYLNGIDFRGAGEGGRSTGTFNNPNQLGFFSACMLSLSYLIYLEGEIKFPTMLGLLAATVLLSIASLSKAAMLANLAVLAFTLKPGKGRVSIAAWILLGLGAVGVAAHLLSSGYFEQFLFFDRIANMAQESDSSAGARGYFAFLESNLLQLIFGMGSPKAYAIVGHEVHSTLGSVWTTYGIFGFTILSSIFAIWGFTLYRTYGMIGVIVLMGPALLYGLTHNGTRFSIFWLLFAASMALAVRSERIRRTQLAIKFPRVRIHNQ